MKIISTIILVTMIATVFAFGGSGSSGTTTTPTPNPTATPVPTPVNPFDSIKVSCTQTNTHERATCLANLKAEDWQTAYPLYPACEKYYQKDFTSFTSCQELAEKANDCRMKPAKERSSCVALAFKDLTSSQKLLWNRLFKLYALEYDAKQIKGITRDQLIAFTLRVETQKRVILERISSKTYNAIYTKLVKQFNILNK